MPKNENTIANAIAITITIIKISIITILYAATSVSQLFIRNFQLLLVFLCVKDKATLRIQFRAAVL